MDKLPDEKERRIIREKLDVAFFIARQGATAFIDRQFKDALSKEFVKQGVEIKDWNGLIECWHGLHRAMGELYAFEALLCLGAITPEEKSQMEKSKTISLPEGTAPVRVEKKALSEPKKTQDSAKRMDMDELQPKKILTKKKEETFPAFPQRKK